MLLSLCLLLPALSSSNQEICSAPGDLSAPTLYMSQTSARPGDSVWLKCSAFSQYLVTRIIFCKDGKEVLFLKGMKEKTIYDYNHNVTGDSSGNYSCGYEIKDSNNRVSRSQLSRGQRLSITGDDPSSDAQVLYLSMGITVPAVLVLAVVLYLLGRKVVSLRKAHRERVQSDISSAPQEHTEYASVNHSGSVRHPRR